MRRLGATLVVLTTAACGPLQDAFTAHAEVAGSAAGQTLSAERLAEVVGRAQRVPLRAEVLTGVANVYLDYTLFAMDLARGRNLHDSALVAAAEWPLLAQLRWERFHDGLVAARGPLTSVATDAAYREGAVRLFQHILVRVPPAASPALDEQKKREAHDLLRQATARHGANFAELAKRHSDDPGSKANGGYLPAMPRGQFVPAFDSVAWALAPGAMSGVVRSPFGYHIIRRPPFAEVRDSFRVGLETARTIHDDSLYLDSLARARDLRVESGAPALVRQAVPQLALVRDDRRVLATYKGGTFRVEDMARWLLALGPNQLRGFATATDLQLRQYVRVLAERDLLLEQADRAGVRLTPADWGQVRDDYDSVVTRLETLTKLTPKLLADSGPTEKGRTDLAMAHVNGYMDRAITAQTEPFYPVPTFLAGALRRGESWSLNEAGIARALERAQAMRGVADSGLRSPPASGLKHAPGPPPVPVDTPKRVSR